MGTRLVGHLDPSIDPHFALLQEVARCAHEVAAWDQMVGLLDPDHMVDPDIAGQTQVLLDRWHKARDHLRKTSEAAVRLNLADRALQVTEAQAAALFTILMAVLQDPSLGLAAQQQDALRVALASRFRALEVSTNVIDV